MPTSDRATGGAGRTAPEPAASARPGRCRGRPATDGPRADPDRDRGPRAAAEPALRGCIRTPARPSRRDHRAAGRRQVHARRRAHARGAGGRAIGRRSSPSIPRARSRAARCSATGSGCRSMRATGTCSSARWRRAATPAASRPRRSRPRPCSTRPASISSSWRRSGRARARSRSRPAADTTVVLEAPEMGDEVQAIKAGLLEVADLVVVNKADRPGAQRTASHLNAMLVAAAPRALSAGPAGPEAAGGAADHGVDRRGRGGTAAAIDRHRVAGWRARASPGCPCRGPVWRRRCRPALNDRLRDKEPRGQRERLVAEVAAHRLDPYAAADELLAAARLAGTLTGDGDRAGLRRRRGADGTRDRPGACGRRAPVALYEPDLARAEAGRDADRRQPGAGGGEGPTRGGDRGRNARRGSSRRPTPPTSRRRPRCRGRVRGRRSQARACGRSRRRPRRPTIFATNTSSIAIDRLAAASPRIDGGGSSACTSSARCRSCRLWS